MSARRNSSFFTSFENSEQPWSLLEIDLIVAAAIKTSDKNPEPCALVDYLLSLTFTRTTQLLTIWHDLLLQSLTMLNLLSAGSHLERVNRSQNDKNSFWCYKKGGWGEKKYKKCIFCTFRDCKDCKILAAGNYDKTQNYGILGGKVGSLPWCTSPVEFLSVHWPNIPEHWLMLLKFMCDIQ